MVLWYLPEHWQPGYVSMYVLRSYVDTFVDVVVVQDPLHLLRLVSFQPFTVCFSFNPFLTFDVIVRLEQDERRERKLTYYYIM